MPTLDELSPTQFRQAIKLSEQIDALRLRLQTILGSGKSTMSDGAKVKGKPGRKPGKRNMTPEGRARIAAAAKTRWVKFRREASLAKASAKTAPNKAGGITPKGRARSASAMNARQPARKKNANKTRPMSR